MTQSPPRFAVRPAKRIPRKLKACLYGESNGGKTLTAIKLARGLVGPEGRIAVIDSEFYRSALYDSITPFDIIDLSLDEFEQEVPDPYTPERYIAALQQLEEDGYDAIIIDSLTPVWSKPGGVLDRHRQISASDKYKYNSFSAWQDTNPIYWSVLDAIQAAKVHIISTVRAKEEWVEVKTDKGKTSWEAAGAAPNFREGIRFEFDFFAKMHDRGQMSIETWRILEDLPLTPIVRPGEELAQKILSWLEGTPLPPPTIEQSLAAWQQAFPASCAKRSDWREAMLRAALGLSTEEALPLSYQDYTEDERHRVKAFVAQRKLQVYQTAQRQRTEGD